MPSCQPGRLSIESLDAVNPNVDEFSQDANIAANLSDYNCNSLMSRYLVPESRRPSKYQTPRLSALVSEGSRSRPMSAPANSRLPEPKKRLTQKDEAFRRKLEEQSKKRNVTTTAPGQTIAKRRTTAAKGTLAALRPSPALTVSETISVAEASRLCATKRTNCFLVVDDDTGLSGIVTAKDLAYRVIADGLDPRTTIVRQVMTPDPTVAWESSSVTDALQLMVSQKFRHLPVCSDDESIIGIIYLTDVLYDTLSNAQRKATASQQLINAMARVTAELSTDASNSEMLAWAAKLHEKTALPDLASVMGTHTQPTTVSPKTSVRVVAQIMREKHASAVCIMEDVQLQSSGAARRPPRIAGILTSEDIVLRVIAPGLDALHCSVVRVMTPRPEFARPTMIIDDAVKKMHVARRSNLPVVENDDRLLAVINILHLAEASQDQINASIQDVVPPEASAESWPTLGRFLESIRGNTPKAEATETTFSSTDDPLLSPRSETSDSIAALEDFSSMSMSIASLANVSTPPTSAPPSIADVHSPRDHFKDFPSPPTTMSPLMSPSVSTDGETYLFKFRAPSGITHRVDARADDYKRLRELVVAKLMTDPLFNSADPNLRPDINDFHMLYMDDDGDDVAITDDSDVRHAINVSKDEGKDRVMLTIRGGPGWTKTDAEKNTSTTTPVVTSSIVNKSETAPVTVPTEAPSIANTHIQEAPPEYTPKSTSSEPSNHPGLPSSAADIVLNVPATTVSGSMSQAPLEIFQLLSPLEGLSATKMPSSLPPVTFPDEKRKPSASVARGGRSEDWATLDKIRNLVTRLAAIFDDLSRYKKLLECQDAHAQRLLDTFQTLLDTPGLSSKFKRNLLVATQRLSRSAGLYPKCYDLEDIEMVEDHPIAAGSFADIYKGRFLGQAVCLKVIRVYQTSHVQSFLKQFSAEAVLWGQLSHLNLLPVYGLYRLGGRLCLVSPWMNNGDITRYLKENLSVTRALLVLDVACGIAYLHDRDIVHGDLKGANILVDGCGRARLADFGLSAVTDSEILHWTSNSSAGSRGGSVRWQAPELLDVENDDIIPNTTASDVYAFACVAYEIFTGNLPFYEAGRDSTTMVKIQAGEHPSRPPSSSLAWSQWGLTEATWSLLQTCWNPNPSYRPTIHAVVSYFQSLIHVDGRPLESDDLVLTPAHFRDSVGGRAGLLSVFDLDAIIDSPQIGDAVGSILSLAERPTPLESALDAR